MLTISFSYGEIIDGGFPEQEHIENYTYLFILYLNKYNINIIITR